MRQGMQFELHSHDDVFSVSPVFLLQCLRIAQEYGHAPSLGESWWREVQKNHPSLMLALDGMKNVEHSKEKDRGESDDFVLFQLSDGQRHCDIDMMTLLTTLQLSERLKIVPLIERTWWGEMLNRYEIFEEIEAFDGCIQINDRHLGYPQNHQQS